MNLGNASDRHELCDLQHEWRWFTALGIGLLILGAFALCFTFTTERILVALIGVVLLVGGVGQVISAFWAGKWSGFLLNLLIGILYVVAAIFLLDNDDTQSIFLLTLLLAAFLIVTGIFRIVVSLSARFSNWGWVMLSGIVALLLGVLIYKGLPDTATYVIGLFVGIELIFNGWYWVMLGCDLKRRHEKGKSEALTA